MQEGYWINYENDDKVFEVREHELWLREAGNAKKLGVPPNVIKSFSKFIPVKDRDKFLLYVMNNAPIMRVRGHGSFVSFEYAVRSLKPIDTIAMWATQNAGEFTTLNIINLATGENTSTSYSSFKETMDKGGADAVMLAAAGNKRMAVRKEIVREILRMAGR